MLTPQPTKGEVSNSTHSIPSSAASSPAAATSLPTESTTPQPMSSPHADSAPAPSTPPEAVAEPAPTPPQDAHAPADQTSPLLHAAQTSEGFTWEQHSSTGSLGAIPQPLHHGPSESHTQIHSSPHALSQAHAAHAAGGSTSASDASTSPAPFPWSRPYGSASLSLAPSASIAPLPILPSNILGNPVLQCDPFNLQAALLGFPQTNERISNAARRFCGVSFTTALPPRFLIDGQNLYNAFDNSIPPVLLGTIYGLMYYANSPLNPSIATVRIDPDDNNNRISPAQAMHIASTILAARQFSSNADAIIRAGLAGNECQNRQVVRRYMSIYPTPMHSLSSFLWQSRRQAHDEPFTPTELVVAGYLRARPSNPAASPIERAAHLYIITSIAAHGLGVFQQIQALSPCYRTVEMKVLQTKGK